MWKGSPRSGFGAGALLRSACGLALALAGAPGWGRGERARWSSEDPGLGNRWVMDGLGSREKVPDWVLGRDLRIERPTPLPSFLSPARGRSTKTNRGALQSPPAD